MPIRAITAFVALPGLTAFILPIVIGVSTHQPMQHLPLALILLGAFVLLWCVREFYVSGRGTLAPWARPKRLVTSRPYRFSRNPMYLCVASCCWAGASCGTPLGCHIYAAVTLGVLFVRVLALEEKWVARQFGAELGELSRAHTEVVILAARYFEPAPAAVRKG